MTLGNLELIPLNTGYQRLDGGAMFGVVPKTLWQRKIPADELNRIRLALRCLLIRGPEGNTLIDTGMGTKFTPQMADRYGLDNTEIDMPRALAAEGLTVNDINNVVLTHLHFDHAGGATANQDGEIAPTFPNAQYFVQAANWEWANHPTPRDQASYLSENFKPLMNAGVLKLLAGPVEILPNIRARISNGHTTAMQCIEIGASEKVIYCADLIPTAAHVRVAWHMGYDLRPLEIMSEKRELLERAASEKAFLFFEHDAEYDFAQVEADGNDFVAKPIA